MQFTADVLVLGVSLCQAFALKLASLMLDGIPCLCSLHERLLAALLLDLVALKLLGQKQGFITRLLVAWRGLCLDNACFVAKKQGKGQQHQPHVGQGSGSRSGLVVM